MTPSHDVEGGAADAVRGDAAAAVNPTSPADTARETLERAENISVDGTEAAGAAVLGHTWLHVETSLRRGIEPTP